MKIISLMCENFKRISVVSITPNGNLVEIAGKNRMGKTSVLDAIWVAFKGMRGFEQTEPIRKGAEQARIRVDLGELVVTRTFSKKKDGETTTAVRVESGDGFRAAEPQKILDQMIGELSMDPLGFLRLKPKEQFDTVRVFVEGFDFEAHDRAHKKDYDQRTDVNRDLARARAAADAIKVPDSIDAQTQPIDEAALITELNGAAEHNGTIETRKTRRNDVRERITKIRQDADANEASIAGVVTRTEAVRDREIARVNDQIKELRRQIELLEARVVSAGEEAAEQIKADETYLREQAKRHRDEADGLQEQLDTADPLPEPIDTEALTARITDARNTNAAIRVREQRAKIVQEADGLETQSKALTDAMAARNKIKADAIAGAKMPVEGLGFGDGAVLLNGLPFNQASDAEQLRTSCAIAMAMHPKLQVLRVRDGSLLDEDSLRMLAEMADKQDCQVWIETVKAEGSGFLLEDGHVRGVGPTADAEKQGSLV